MIKAPVKNTRRAKAILIGAGIASILVARFLPSELDTLHTILQLLGVGVIGVGGVQVVQKPKLGGA
jgi:hypothetical protein